MKITKTNLQQLIREELAKLKEVERDLPDLEDLDERLETLINNLDRARIARNYTQLRELLAQATAFDMEIANIQTLITT
jgi:predicted phage-related endonuclease